MLNRIYSKRKRDWNQEKSCASIYLEMALFCTSIILISFSFLLCHSEPLSFKLLFFHVLSATTFWCQKFERSWSSGAMIPWQTVATQKCSHNRLLFYATLIFKLLTWHPNRTGHCETYYQQNFKKNMLNRIYSKRKRDWNQEKSCASICLEMATFCTSIILISFSFLQFIQNICFSIFRSSTFS